MLNVPSTLVPNHRFLERVWNTYIRVPLPWRGNYWQHKHWARQQIGDQHGPNNYIELQPSSHVLVDQVIGLAPSIDSRVLDVGCNIGRHLNAMLSRGYKNLYGVDVQQAALDHMSEIFPGLRDTADIRQGTFQAVLPTFADKFFDVVFSHGATIELVPPTFRACKQLARISSKAVVLVVSEFSQAYPRLWEREFLAEGMLLTRLARPCTPGDDSSLMVFERIR